MYNIYVEDAEKTKKLNSMRSESDTAAKTAAIVGANRKAVLEKCRMIFK